MRIADRTLGDLAFMMREEQVHAAAVNVELGAQVFGAHGRALDVPAREALPPGTIPTHDVLWRCRLPQGEIGLISFFFLAFETACRFQKVFDDPTT
jgi:hypothetical protein